MTTASLRKRTWPFSNSAQRADSQGCGGDQLLRQRLQKDNGMQKSATRFRQALGSVRALRLTAYICLPVALVLVYAGVALSEGLVSRAVLASAGLPLFLGFIAHIRASILDADGVSDSWTDDDLATTFTRACDRIYWICSWPAVPLVYVAVSLHGRQKAKAVARAAISRAQRRRDGERRGAGGE